MKAWERYYFQENEDRELCDIAQRGKNEFAVVQMFIES